MNPQDTGNLIAKLRKEKNLTQKDLAEKLSVTPKAISRWETGRGYPDIEILPDLSKVLNVSINDLLGGVASIANADKSISEEPIIYVCNNAAQTKKKDHKKILWLAISLGITSLLLIFSGIYILFSSTMSIIMGVDPDCVIARDYSYITYNGEKYIPIDTKGYTFCDNEEIVKEATIEGDSVFGKLLFGNSVNSVIGVSDNEIIHLVTDYDFAPSEYYVKETKFERIEQHIENFKGTKVYTMDGSFEFFDYDCLVKADSITVENFWEMLFNLHEYVEEESGVYDDTIVYNKTISVVTSDEQNLVYKARGEIILKGNKYYWVECKGNSFDENFYKSLGEAYPIEKEYYSIIEDLFSATKNY